MLSTFSQNLTVQEAFKTAAQMNQELEITEFDGAFCKEIKLLIDRLFIYIFRKKWLEKMIHQKKNRGHRTSKIVY